MNFDEHLLIRTNNLVIQHTKRMHRIMFSSVACLARSYFATSGLYLKRSDFWNKVFEDKMSVRIFFTKSTGSANIKFREIPSGGTQVVPYGQRDRRTGRHEETNILFLQFCESA